MSGQLHNKVAVVTGAASGIGRAVARRFLAEGAAVIGFDRTETPAELANEGVERYGGVIGDVRSASDNQRAVEIALSRFGKLDVFVANAGIYDNRRRFDSYSASELELAFQELFDVNVKGYLMGALVAAPELTKTRGCILFTSSISGTHAGFGGTLYVAAKHAVNGLTRQLALELAPHVRVNAVAPGYVPTALKGIESLNQLQNTAGPAPADMPLQVIGSADDYAAAYVYLASDACARTATGTVLTLDGGSSLRGPRL
jgi:NAD(P)-dependent dehydrogenase (short-subunit alcohol dehydrogenase family)